MAYIWVIYDLYMDYRTIWYEPDTTQVRTQAG